jgi:hypothetical protein
MIKSKYLRIAKRINNKIKQKIPLSDNEIAIYYGIDTKLIKNICFMYENFGRESVVSITLSEEEIDEIIRLKYCWF